MKKNDFLKKIFSEIKKDNLANFKKLLTDNKAIYFKNKQKENLLFYALQSGSLQISEYLIKEHPEFLLERNSYLLTPFSDLIYRDNKKGFNAFLKLSNLPNLSLESVFNKGGEVYTIPLLAVEKLSQENWIIFEKLTKQFWDNKSLIATDRSGYNIAHKIAINNAEYADSILSYLPTELFTQLDSELGSTPFLTSLKFSDLSLIKKFLHYSDIYQKTLLGSNAVHLAVFNNDIEVLKFVLEELKEQPELITSSNLYGDSPLMSAINNQNTEALEILIPYHIEQKKDLTEEIIHFIKTSPKNFDRFKIFLNSAKPDNLKELLNNEEYLGVLFSYIFHYGVESDLKEFQKMFFWDFFSKIDSKFLCHQIYSATILGKKSINYKINYLLKHKEFLTSIESQHVFTPNKDIDLYFYNEDYRTFNKNSKIASFISLLNTMPGSQIIDLINKTNFLEKTDDLDKFHLLTIALKKENFDLLSKIHLSKDLKIKGHMNCVLIVQDLLADYDYNEEFQPYFNHIISQLDFKPIRLFHNYIDKIFMSEPEDKMNKIYSVLSLFKDFPHYKKDFIHLLIYRLTQTEEDQSELLSLFVKNDKAVLSAIENISPKHINKLKNNEFTQHILSVYGERKNLIDFLIDIAHSDNINKYDLMNFILPRCVLNTSASKRLSKQVHKKPIDDYGWFFIFKNFSDNKSLTFLMDTYFSSKNKFDDLSKDIIQIIPELSEISQTYLYNCFSNFNNTSNEIEILQALSNKIDFNYQIIINNAFENYNFKPISYLIQEGKIEINNLNLSQFWHNFDINNFFIDLKNKDKLNSQPLNNFIEFLDFHKNQLSDTNFQNLANEFIKWLEKVDTNENNIAMIRTINIFFKIFNEKIDILADELLVNVCKIVISNSDLNNLNSANQEYEEILNNIFSNKEYDDDFFKQINNNHFFIDNKDKFPEEQLKRLHFYSLKDKFVPKTVKVKNTIKI